MPTGSDLPSFPGYPIFLDRLDPRDAADLRSRAKLKTVPANGPVFSQSSPIDEIYIIAGGRVKAYYTTPEGQAITLAYWQTGMLLGVPGLTAGFDHMWSADATVETQLLQLARSELRNVIERSNKAAQAMIEILEYKAKYLSRLAQILGTASVSERLSIVLRHLADVHGTPEANGMRIELPLTHADIGEMVGASRQWVTVSLGKMEKAGLLTVSNRRIVVVATHAAGVPGKARTPD